MRAKFSFIIILMLYTLNVFSQEDLTVLTKISKDTIGFFDILTVNFEANNFEAELKEPTFKDFEIYIDKGISVSQAYQNGIQTSKKVVTYYLKPKRQGKLILESVTFVYNEKTFETKPITIQVKGETLVNDPLKDGNKIFIVAQISNYNPYCYQPVTVDYKMYYDDELKPETVDFAFDAEYSKQFLIYTIDTENSVTKEKFDGKEYNCILIRKDVIRFKQLYDTYISNRIIVGYKTKRKTPDFAGMFDISRKILPVVSERIKAKTLETNDKFPFNISSFGDYKLEVFHPKKTKIKKDKIIEITLQLYGEGYIEDSTIPLINIPRTFEIISNTIKNEHFLVKDKINSIATRTYKIKPLSEGDYTFYPTQYYFYNEGLNKRKAISSEKFTLSVK